MSWGFRFASECVAEVAAKTLTAQVPSYQTILELDRIVRDFPIPELPAEMPFNPTRPAMTMTRYVLSHSREVSMYFSLHSFLSFFLHFLVPLYEMNAHHNVFNSSTMHPPKLLRPSDDR